ncbi:MAG: restriction endonuclease subunit S [Nanoarchaeota archaeon]|nr:restriction endonuclease subunit S [Nanoarchaeota archaeon]
MPLKQFTTDFQEFTTHQHLRFDEKFWFTVKNLAVYNYVLLKDIFNLINGNSYTKYYTEEKTNIPYIRIGDLSFKYKINTHNLIYLDESCKINKEKKLKKDDLILATIGATIGKINLAREFKDGTFSNNTILLRLKDKEKHNPYFYEKLFQSDLIQKYIWGVISQKAQPNLQSYDLENIKIPLILKSKQDQIVTKIEPIERKIKELKGKIIPVREIINKVFAREFKFDLKKFEELNKIKNYYLDLFSFGNNKDIRQSVKFHRETGYFVNNELRKITNKKIKDFISEPIVLGKGVSPKDYDKSGDYYYVSMANIKNWKFENKDSKLISKEYSSKNQNKTVLKNDILIARSGEGTIGKVALIDDEDLQGIFADFTMRVRLLDYNYLFAYYYFRTNYFQYLIEINKKGLGNNTNIFPSQIQEFPMIDISLKNQQKIVDEIKTELDKQEDMNKKIETEGSKINGIIEKAIAV